MVDFRIMCRVASLLSKGVEISSGFICNQESRITLPYKLTYSNIDRFDTRYRVTKSIIFVRSWFHRRFRLRSTAFGSYNLRTDPTEAQPATSLARFLSRTHWRPTASQSCSSDAHRLRTFRPAQRRRIKRRSCRMKWLIHVVSGFQVAGFPQWLAAKTGCSFWRSPTVCWLSHNMGVLPSSSRSRPISSKRRFHQYYSFIVWLRARSSASVVDVSRHASQSEFEYHRKPSVLFR